MSRFFVSLVCGACCLLPAVANAEVIRYELQIAGTLPGNAAGKSALVGANGATVQLDLFMLVQGDDGNATNETLKLSTGYIQSNAGSLLVNLQGITPTGPFSQSPAGVSTGTLFDMFGDGDNDIGNSTAGTGFYSVGVSSTTDYGFGAGVGTRDGFISAASLGLSGDDFAYAKIFSITATVNDLSLLGGDSTILSFLPRTTTNQHQSRSDGANYNSTAAALGIGAGVTLSAIPEPGTWALGSLVLAGLAGLKLRRKKA